MTDKTIFEYIKILLPRHKCVTIPGFGAFILNKEDRKDFDVHVTTPTVFTITFNSRLQHDDGVLTSYIQSVCNISYDKASKDLSNIIRELRKQLLLEKKISCSSLGKIELLNGSLIFTQEQDYLCPSHYGLTAVQLSTIAELNATIERSVKTSSLKKKIAIAAASAAAALLLILPSSNIIDNSVAQAKFDGGGYLKSLVEFKTPEVLTPKAEGVNISQESAVVEAQEKVIDNIAPRRITNNNKSNNGRTYYLIIGGESSANLANKALDKFKKEGFESAQILESVERHRIYIQSFDNKQDADAAVAKFRKENPQYKAAWIHSRKS